MAGTTVFVLISSWRVRLPLFRKVRVSGLALALALAGCDEQATSLKTFTAAKPAEFGGQQDFSIGQTVTYADGLALQLQAIEDSRCQEGHQYIWQGELAPVLKLSGGDIGRASREIRLGTVRATQTMVENYQFVLSRATPTSASVIVTKPGVQAQQSVDAIRITSPGPQQLVSSPLEVKGTARGPWYFEATFPVKLVDADGKVIAETYAQAEGEWMTENFVPFTATVQFDTPATATGTLVLEKNNPSGLPEHADSRGVPVQFSTAEPTQPAPPETSAPADSKMGTEK